MARVNGITQLNLVSRHKKNRTAFSEPLNFSVNSWAQAVIDEIACGVVKAGNGGHARRPI